MKLPASISFSIEERITAAAQMLANGYVREALVEFTKLEDEGHDEALSFLGNIYEMGGAGVPRDLAKARKYYELSIERRGSVAACLRLIRIYYYGLGVPRDCGKALEYCDALIAERNHPEAHFFLGRMYLEGSCLEEDLQAAKAHFKESWSGGYVFGLTFLGLAEQRSGHWWKGWALRIKAGLTAYWLAKHNPDDPRIRNP